VAEAREIAEKRGGSLEDKGGIFWIGKDGPINERIPESIK
jgi:hypothetical protein